MAVELLLPKQLTSACATVCLAELIAALGRKTTQQDADVVVANAEQLEQFDSSALAVLLELRRACQAARKQFSVVALPPRLRDLGKLYGVAELLPALSR